MIPSVLTSVVLYLSRVRVFEIIKQLGNRPLLFYKNNHASYLCTPQSICYSSTVKSYKYGAPHGIGKAGFQLQVIFKNSHIYFASLSKAIYLVDSQASSSWDATCKKMRFQFKILQSISNCSTRSFCTLRMLI